MSATAIAIKSVSSHLPADTLTPEQDAATDSPVADTATIQAPAGRVLYHGSDGKWYTSESLPSGLDLPLQEITAADASQWYTARAQARPSLAEYGYCFRRIVKEWRLQYRTASGTVKDNKGMRYIQELLSRPHKHVPATTLARLDSADEPGSSVQPNEIDDEGHPLIGMGGSEDFILPPETIRLYRREMTRLAKRIKEARENFDREAVTKLQAEFQFYHEDLAKNTREGNKPKRFATGDGSEKARSAVTQAMRRAFQAIRKSDSSLQPLSDYLQSHIETGVKCVYRPGEERIRWDVD